MKATVKYQDKKTGLWYDVMDVKDSRNYLEATASSMFTYVLLKGSRLGYFDGKLKEAGIKGYKGILNNFIKVNDDKTISLTRCCEVSGLGPGMSAKVLKAAPKVKENKRRDGSFEYYISEPIRENDGKGVGPFIWASLEMEQMGYTVQNLFTFTGIHEAEKTPKHNDMKRFTLDGRRVNTNRSTSPILLHNGNRWRLVAPSH